MPTYSDGDWEFDVNEIRADNREHLVAFGDLLVAAGWTCIGSSDGTTPKAGRNTLADWNNTNAWEHFRDPGGIAGRDFVWQRSTVPGTLRAWLGRAAQPFTGGTGSTVPTASGALQILGSGGGYQFSFFPTTTTSVRVHMGARTSPLGTSGDVYAFWMVIRTTPSGAATGYFAVLPLLSPYDGTVGDADSEPWVATTGTGEVHVTSALLRGWYRAGLSGASAVSTLICSTPGSFGAYSGQSPYSGEDDLAPLFVSDATGGVAQRKGVVQDFTAENMARADLDTYNLATSGRARVQFGQLTFPWPATVAPQF